MDYDEEDYDQDDDGTEPCPYCQAYVYYDAERCPSCGQYILDADTSASRQPAWVVVTAVVLLAAMAYWLLSPLW